MKKSDLSEELKKEFNILTRFLKDNGAYMKFLRYLNDKHIVNNVTSGRDIFEMIIRNGTTTNIITLMITWDRTKEGYGFWQNLHYHYNKIIGRYHYEQRKNNKASSQEKREAHSKRAKVV